MSSVLSMVSAEENIERDKLAAKPFVEYHNICKSFGDVEILRGVDLQVQPGEKVAIIGPSGSGKTTLARMLMTLEEPTSGTIKINGKHLWHEEINGKLMPASERHFRKIRGEIGMVFQQYNLFPHMTILRNVMEAQICVLGREKKEAQNRAIEMLTKVGLENKLDAYPVNLSGGQQQRVAIARALVMKPKIMLFDEVTAALDPELVGEVLQVIREIAKEEDMAMLLITHEMEFARQIADRIIFMADGVIVEQGTPNQIFKQPKQERTIEFLQRFRASSFY
ncbi:ectoine/hydroxyectoine ABC transporter ATP-binding protein EhuA [Niallia alba]|uniref:ectoine/hydroxyectoine ABC transporter ATP-binding protein EhuA n=1 Tax=Niallia alba TaxID=2729105 RepID=UPI002E209E5D|nr:ectoine/hydroxyectoine ABC transporter ATP-binding protein EhuA [Niallia alba]